MLRTSMLRAALVTLAVAVLPLVATVPVGAQEAGNPEATPPPPSAAVFGIVGPCTPTTCTVAAYAYDRTLGESGFMEVALAPPMGTFVYQAGPHAGMGWVKVSEQPGVPKNLRFCGFFFTKMSYDLSPAISRCARVSSAGAIVYG